MRKAINVVYAVAALSAFSFMASCVQTGVPIAVNQVHPDKMTGMWIGSMSSDRWTAEAELDLSMQQDSVTGTMTEKRADGSTRSYSLVGKASGENLSFQTRYSGTVKLALSRGDDGTLFLNGSWTTEDRSGRIAVKRKQ